MAALTAAWAWALAQWPQVYPNLIASGICTGAVWVKLHLHHRKAAARHERLERLLHRVLAKEDVIEREEKSSCP